MKNFIFKTLLAAGLLSSFGSVFASDLTCPSVDQIKSINFTEAHSVFDSGDGWFWMLNSSPFMHADVNWNLWFGGVLSVKSQDQAEALRQGQIEFAKVSLNSNPTPEKDHDVNVCVYSTNDDSFVAAVTPPVQIPGAFAKFRK
jgi:hypothetical protein